MHLLSSRAGFLLLALGLPLGCGGAEDPLFSDQPGAADDFLQGSDQGTSTLTQASSAVVFPGAGSSGAAQPLSAGLGPESSSDCDPAPAAGTIAETPVQHVCFFAAEDPSQLAASIEQVVEVVGNDEWVHLRLTLNPDFVDNTYGETALGWGEQRAPDAPDPGLAKPPQPKPQREHPDRAAPPAPPDDAPPPPAPGDALPPADAAPGGAPPAAAPKPGGHSFRDLVGSDHAEIQLLDASGNIALDFWLDYLSPSDAAPSGYASLGVSGGEGRVTIGDPAWILATTSSLDRNLNACGLGGFVGDSPPTDPSYSPDPAASAWDYRVSYEAWVSTAAFGGAGFGSALIELVHASPSKHGGNSLDVLPAPCPADPENAEVPPEPLPPVLSTIR